MSNSTPKVLCPKCGSDQFSSNKKGFSVGKAAAGLLIPGGVLWGFHGSKKIVITCLSCGCQFEPGQQKVIKDKIKKDKLALKHTEQKAIQATQNAEKQIAEIKAREEKERPIRQKLNKHNKKSDHADVQDLAIKLNELVTEYKSKWEGSVIDVEAKPWDLGIDIFGNCKEKDGSIGGMNQDLINSKTEEFLFLVRDRKGFAEVWFTSKNIYCWKQKWESDILAHIEPGTQLDRKQSPYIYRNAKVYDFKQQFLSSKWKSKTLDMVFSPGVEKDQQANMIDALSDFINTRTNQVTSDDSLKETGIKDYRMQDSVIDSSKDTKNNEIKNINDIFNLNKAKNGIVIDPSTALDTIKTGFFGKWFMEYEIEGEVLFGLKCNAAINEIVTKDGIYRKKKGVDSDFVSFKNIEEFEFVKSTGFLSTNKLIDRASGMSIDLGIFTQAGNSSLDKGSIIIPTLLSYLNQLAKD